MRVLIAGGGTGGHVIPALAVARELRERHAAEVRFVGTSRGIETRLVPAAGFPLDLIQVGALKNVGLATRIKTLFDLPKAIWHCMQLIGSFKPDVVIGVGGYASGPGMLAALLRRTPTLAFEPNLVPGFTNRMVGKRVSAAAVHFAETSRYFRNARVTGVPVRGEFFSIRTKAPTNKTVLLVFGGSQGARAMNRVMLESLEDLYGSVPNLEIIHQTGESDFSAADAAYTEQVKRGRSGMATKFINDMPEVFSRADLILCRSGASTVAEITAAGKPAVFVPFPQAADDHQRKNAEALVAADAAALIPQGELTKDRLVKTLAGLLREPRKLAQMGENARKLAHPKAVAEIATMVVGLVKKK